MEDRRRYFRLTDKMIVNYYPISVEDMEIRVREMQAGIERNFSERQPLLGLETQIKGIIEQFRDKSPEFSYAVELLNAKIDYMMKYIELPDGSSDVFQNQPAREVNISACGVAFYDNNSIEVDKKVVLEMVVIPEYTYMIVYGTVVLCKEANKGQYRIGIDFDYIREEDQERLIQHILKKQAEYIKARKKSQEGG